MIDEYVINGYVDDGYFITYILPDYHPDLKTIYIINKVNNSISITGRQLGYKISPVNYTYTI